MKSTALTVVLGLLGLMGGNSLALAEAAYPEKPLQLIVPFPPGGASDVVARIIGGELETRLGKPAVIMNRPGGGTTIAAKEVARAAPDGYTLFFSSNSSFTLPAAVKESVPYDAAKDFEPIGQTGKITLALVTYKDNPITDVAALVAEAKANPDKLSLASFGVATVSHFAGELFKSAAGVKMVHLPYKGSAPAMNDLIGKHIQYHVDTVIAVKPQIEAGTVKVLAVFSGKRTPYLPDVPTLAELGYTGIDFSSWGAVVAPKGLPPAVRDKLTVTLEEIIKSPSVVDRFSKVGFEPGFMRYSDWEGAIGKETAEMKEIAQRAGIKEE
ncbi:MULTISPECIES: Bug family tripartite tricarboxylate transporter substrate binding protein [Bradyrhizobium]|uniref:Bug family tripartite tricarboxylate transporter substrate binding protein n=1 Tax=Bradyrhizobium TaxID=374 RepID=UPI001BA8A494|nr:MULTISPECIES: tripartite tricarboxylate transporter substrate binding protein [Bradyrhizobium]MBR0711188.1 tripartite tricarboxylate transporter substrate binding protein [Bradyrhizobium liaoningense]MDA9403729.1 ABC transporter substrate-binding protein [Bradyrhizobium sp. CCBAU 45389]